MALQELEPETTAQWEEFFINKLRVSKDIGRKYAEAFVDEGYDGESIKHLLAYSTPGVPSPPLLELGLKAGHCLKLAIFFNPPSTASAGNTAAHNAGSLASTNPQSHRPHVRHQPPQLQPSMTPSSFRQFTSHWTMYKKLVGILPNSEDAAAHINSLACADHPEIRRTIADHKPNHLLLSESEYIEMLRKLLTAQAAPDSYRHKFFNMAQNQEETCHHWLKRLQEVAPDCEFTIVCDHNPNTLHRFDDSLLKTKFVLGLSDQTIKQDLIARSSELTTLNQVFNYATRIEATSRDMKATKTIVEKAIAGISIDQDCFSSGEEYEVGKLSTYRKTRNPSRQKTSSRHLPNTEPKRCSGCGSNQHTNLDRSSKCPAWGKVCKSCGKRGHFSSVCPGTKATDCANAVIASMKIENKIQSNQIEICVTPVVNGKKSAPVNVMAYPDTGATLCVTDLNTLKTLGIRSSQLKPTTRNIITATGSEIICRGCIETHMTIGDRTTKQKLYICDNITRTYLSKTGCTALGIIHKDFPKPLPIQKPPQQQATAPESSIPELPKKPLKIPFAPTKANIPLLKDYLLKVFAKSAFNNDKSVYFPKMLGVPKAKIHTKPDAVPYFRATPNQIPYHWRDAGKELVDEWVNRGLIKKTPIGTPTPWCSAMVLTPKKSNTLKPKIRMTIDLQHLNSQCIRELHHVESPFKLVSQIPNNTFKTVLDAVDGYQAIELDEESASSSQISSHTGAAITVYEFLLV